MGRHSELADDQLHQVKGAVDATEGQVLTAVGDGTAAFQNQAPVSGTATFGIYDYNDLATQTTPIALTLANTLYTLTNDGAGDATLLDYGITGLSTLWDVDNGYFVWDTDGILSVGDTIDVRYDLEVTTTTPNSAVSIVIVLGTGEELNVNPEKNFKAAGTHPVVDVFHIYMGSETTLSNPAYLKIKADTTGVSVVVNGWYVRACHRY